MASLEERVDALELNQSGMMQQLAVTPTSRQVADALDPLRDELTNQQTQIDALEAAIQQIQGAVVDLSYQVIQLRPSGSL